MLAHKVRVVLLVARRALRFRHRLFERKAGERLLSRAPLVGARSWGVGGSLGGAAGISLQTLPFRKEGRRKAFMSRPARWRSLIRCGWYSWWCGASRGARMKSSLLPFSKSETRGPSLAPANTRAGSCRPPLRARGASRGARGKSSLLLSFKKEGISLDF